MCVCLPYADKSYVYAHMHICINAVSFIHLFTNE